MLLESRRKGVYYKERRIKSCIQINFGMAVICAFAVEWPLKVPTIIMIKINRENASIVTKL